jgi:hypothetical protein
VSEKEEVSYEEFLRAKQVAKAPVGFPPTFLPDVLKGFQKYLCEWSLNLGRAAIYADCGLGKSILSLVHAQNVVERTNKPVLILAPLAVSRQFVQEGKKFSVPCKQTQDGTVHKGINVTNYERISNYNPEDFAGVVADEAGILKNSDGKTRRLVTDFMEKIKYRLLGTATPAPNDYMELGTSSEALGVMPYRNMLAMFFVNDGKSTQQWRLKGHAKTRFWQWMATWARAVRKPSDLGFDDEGYDLPELEIEQHLLPSGKKGVGLLPYEAKTLSELREERHRTLHSRCRKVADLCPPDRPALSRMWR